jgi:hypothetical protein
MWYSASEGLELSPTPSLTHPHLTTRPLAAPQGIGTPEGCLPEFSSDGAASHLAYNLIAMSPEALSETADATVEACQAACSRSAACQYFVFQGADARCYLRDKVPYSKVDVNDTSKDMVFFEVGRRAII